MPFLAALVAATGVSCSSDVSREGFEAVQKDLEIERALSQSLESQLAQEGPDIARLEKAADRAEVRLAELESLLARDRATTAGYRERVDEAEAEAAKSDFVSIVSHELRTPLTSVKTSLSLLVKGAAGKVTQQMRDFVNIALRNLDRLIRLVDDLLDLSKIQSGHASIELVPVSVKKAADGAVDAVHGFAQERQVRLESKVSDDATFVMADPDRLEQVIINLLSNAIKFSPPQACVALRWWKEREAAVLEVCDEGPGIPPDQLDTILEKFKQFETSATRPLGGVGLGLAISHTLVEHFGGDLWAESEEGCGSRFFVRLKLAE